MKRRAARLSSARINGRKFYSKRIDDTIAAMKSKGVPVLMGWSRLRSAAANRPPTLFISMISTGARAERAGLVYIDIWDGFVDEAGKYSNFGPDYEGQMRRLRSS